MPRLWSPGMKSWAEITSQALPWGAGLRRNFLEAAGNTLEKGEGMPGMGRDGGCPGWWLSAPVGAGGGHSPRHHELPDGAPSPGAPREHQ